MTTAVATAPWADRVLCTEPPGHPKWIEAHKKVLGGHDVASLLGYGRETPFQLWAKFTEKVEREDISELPWIQDGSDFEPIVARRYERETGNRLLPSPGLVRHPTVEYLAGTPDGLVEEGFKPLGLFEAKTFAMWSRDEWQVQVPEGYQVQAQLYLMVLQLDWCAVAAMQQGGRKRGDPGVLTFDVYPDANIAQWILDAAGEFMEHVQRDTPPAAIGDDTTVLRRLHAKEAPGKIIQLDDIDLALWQEKEALSADVKAADGRIEEIKAHFMQKMADAHYGVLPDGRAMRFQSQNRKGYVVEAGETRVLSCVKGLPR